MDLQTRLLDDIDDQVDVTQTRMKAATLKVRARVAGGCGFGWEGVRPRGVHLRCRARESSKRGVRPREWCIAVPAGCCAQVKQLLRDTSHWKGGLCIFILIITLVIVLVLAFKLIRLFS